MKELLDQMRAFQLMRYKNPEMSDEEVSELAKSTLGEQYAHIKRVVLFDEKMLDLVKELEAYSEPVQSLFNQIRSLIDNSAPTLSDNSSRLIKTIIDNEGLADFKLSDDIQNYVTTQLNKDNPDND